MSELPLLSFSTVFRDLIGPDEPSATLIRSAFDAIFAGSWTPTQVAAFVVALRLRGETPAMIASAVHAMRSVMVGVEHGLGLTFDTCGTGGDGLNTINVSTAAAVVIASTGLAVAKHGNRGASSRAGSADVLEALGIPIDVPPHRQAAVLREAGITFLFAPSHHPAMRHATQARRELGIRTIFNALGPLANPACVSHQLVGTYDHALRPMMAETLRMLGTRRAWIVRGDDGLDEVSPTGPTRVTELDGGQLTERVIVPDDFGLEPTPLEALKGGDAQENAHAIESIFAGEPHPAKMAVVLNAAAALVVAHAIPYREATARADEAIRSGRARETLIHWRTVAQRAKADA